jgi:hypothetical protein
VDYVRAHAANVAHKSSQGTGVVVRTELRAEARHPLHRCPTRANGVLERIFARADVPV